MSICKTPGEAAKIVGAHVADRLPKAAIEIVSYTPKGKGGWGTTTKRTRFYLVSGNVRQRREKYAVYGQPVERNGICWSCGDIFIEQEIVDQACGACRQIRPDGFRPQDISEPPQPVVLVEADMRGLGRGDDSHLACRETYRDDARMLEYRIPLGEVEHGSDQGRDGEVAGEAPGPDAAGSDRVAGP